MRKNPKRNSKSKSAKGIHLDPKCIALMRLVESGRQDEVEVLARRLLQEQPRHSLALKALGFALIGLERFEEALAVIESALQVSPHDPELCNNRGIVLSMLMRWDESLEAFNRSLELRPKHPETLKNLGVAYFRMHRWNEAVPPLLQAIEVYPGDYVDAIGFLAGALTNASRIDEAWTCYNELWRGDPENVGALADFLSISLRRCDWSDWRQLLGTLREKSNDFASLCSNPFSPLAWPGVTGTELMNIAQNFLRTQIPHNFLGAGHAEYLSSVAANTKPLRVGYLSADFRNHPVGQVIAEVIERHDRERVEVIGYSLGIDDGSALRARLSRSFDRFVNLADLGVGEMARRIRDDGVQILVDLHGWTSEGRPEVLALRCAPVQVNWLGYAGTLGHAKLAEYVLGDPVVTPFEHGSYYCEAIAQLPWSYMPIDTTILPGERPNRQVAGLPESGFVFCSFNNSYKFNPDVFDLWSRILLACPGSVLWLSQPPGDGADRLKREISLRGVAPERLIFANRVAGREEHLGRLQLADLALDPFPYNSHSTGGDILMAGVPMVALLGDTFPARVGASLLRAARVGELIAESKEAYFDLAVALFQNPGRLKKVRDRLAPEKRGSLPFFDMRNLAAELENLYARMWEDWRQGVRRPLLATAHN